MTEPFRLAPMKPLIPLEWLDKIDVRVGTVEWVGDVQGSDRLVRLLVDCGDRKRQVLVGMKRERPEAKERQGRQAFFIVNLEPKTVMGVVSEAMMFDIGYADGILPVLAIPERPVPDGARRLSVGQSLPGRSPPPVPECQRHDQGAIALRPDSLYPRREMGGPGTHEREPAGGDRMGYLYPLWLFVAAVFFYFAYISWRQSGSALHSFHFRDRGGGEDDPGKAQEMDPYLQEFVGDWNRYLDSMNSSYRARNRAAAVGFFVTGICALISMFVLIPR